MTSSDKKVIAWTDALLSDARAAKDDLSLDTRYAEYRRVYDGPGQWTASRPPMFFANLLKNYILRLVSLMTDSKPEMMVVSRRADLGAAARIFSDTSKAVWSHLSMQDVIGRATLTASITGAVGFSTVWNPDADDGRGDIEIVVIPPDCLYLDPAVTSAEEVQQGEYVAVKQYVPLALLAEKFPGRGLLVKGASRLPPRRATGQGGRRVVAPTQGSRTRLDSESAPRGEIYTMYVKSYETTTQGKRRYPGGRVIIRSADGVLLSDDHNPYWDGQFPIDMWSWLPHHSHPWGESEVAILRKPAEAYNRIGDLFIRNAINTGNTRVVGDTDALLPSEWNKLDNLEGIIIKKRFGREVRIDPPPTLPPHFPQLMKDIPQIMEILSGLMDVAPGGAHRGGSPSMSAFEGLQQNALSLMRQRIRLLESVVERIGNKLISRILQYYTGDRMFSIVGPSQHFTQYLFKRASLLMNDGQETQLVRNEGEHRNFLREFAFRVVPNSGLFMNRVQRVLMAQQLLTAHIVDRKFVLDTLGPEMVPDGEAVLQRADKELQQQAEMGIQAKGRGVRSNRKGTSLSIGQ